MPDLCQLADVKTWLNLNVATSDALLNRLITATSNDFLNEIERVRDFTPAAQFTDVLTLASHNITAVLPVNIPWYYNGIGEFKIGLRHWPINSIQAVVLDGNVVPQSPDGIQNGWFLAGDNEPEFRSTLLLIGQYVKLRQSKLAVTYMAGYASAAHPQPAAPTVSAVAGGTFGAKTYYFKTTTQNAIGESVVSPEASLSVLANNLPSIAAPADPGNSSGYNVYGATASGAETKQNTLPIPFGTAWTLPTTGLVPGPAAPTADSSASVIPTDVVQAVIEWSSFRYRGRENIGKTSVHMQQGETVQFDKGARPPGVQDVIDRYGRAASLNF